MEGTHNFFKIPRGCNIFLVLPYHILKKILQWGVLFYPNILLSSSSGSVTSFMRILVLFKRSQTLGSFFSYIYRSCCWKWEAISASHACPNILKRTNFHHFSNDKLTRFLSGEQVAFNFKTSWALQCSRPSAQIKFWLLFLGGVALLLLMTQTNDLLTFFRSNSKNHFEYISSLLLLTN